MISVIIPVLNESETIGSMVEFARRDPKVREVIVVDYGFIDGAPERAAAAGATVVTSTLLGKGASMEDGMRAANAGILLYLDGDLVGLRENLIECMTGPIASGCADFVKANFSRGAGRVTTLTARPLLATFFPELASFEQPLGGIVAARRSLLQELQFETDYGVDVGLLIDAACAEARLAQAHIGHLEHAGQPPEPTASIPQGPLTGGATGCTIGLIVAGIVGKLGYNRDNGVSSETLSTQPVVSWLAPRSFPAWK